MVLIGVNEHCIVLKDLYRHFSVLRKCMNKFDYLVHENEKCC